MDNNKLKYISGLFFFIAVFFASCDKTDNFKDELDGIPQISYGERYKYKNSYVVGDILQITGILYPEKGLRVEVGGVDAPVIKTEKIVYYGSVGGRDSLDRVSVEIKEAMGLGTDRSVAVILGSNRTEGSPIAIYGLGGEGSLSQALQLNAYTDAAVNSQNTYLHCINGEGDVYYLGYSDKSLWHVDKNGTVTQLLTQEELRNGETWRFSSFTPFLAGGVNPQKTKAWVSIYSTNPTAYRFVEIDLQTKEVKTLNVSSAIAANYQGNIAEVNTIISGIYPDSKGNIYLLIGNSQAGAQAVGAYDSNTGNLSYIYKTVKAATDMPGSSLNIDFEYQGIAFRCYPEEGSLYVEHNYMLVTGSGESKSMRGFTLYNLPGRLQQAAYKTSGGNEYIGPFSSTPETFIGNFLYKLPMPGRRLLGLYGQGLTSGDLPQWLVLSFSQERSYYYAPDKFDTNGFSISSSDEVINYDKETGAVYMTGANKTKLLRAVIQNN